MQMMTWQSATRKHMTWQGRQITDGYLAHQIRGVTLTQSMRTVKILAIKSIGPNLDQVVGFLTCFLCMEKLLTLQESATLPSAMADGKGMDGGRQRPR